FPGELKKSGKPDILGPKLREQQFPLSAWTVSQQVRDAWTGIISRTCVRRVFAGHFHSELHQVYVDRNWAMPLRDSYQYPPESFEKLLVCPPIAGKLQLQHEDQARGFRDVTIDGTSGDVTSTIVWFNSKTGK